MAVRTALTQAGGAPVAIFASTVAHLNLGGLMLSISKKRVPLACVAIRNLRLDATVESDGAVDANICLQELAVKDTRPDCGYGWEGYHSATLCLTFAFGRTSFGARGVCRCTDPTIATSWVGGTAPT
jgi:hypothetical protein